MSDEEANNGTTVSIETLSNAKKYNECNPRDDSYCLFEEKAKKYDDLMSANAEVVQTNIDITKEHQMIKALKKLNEESKCMTVSKFERGFALGKFYDDFQNILEDNNGTK